MRDLCRCQFQDILVRSLVENPLHPRWEKWECEKRIRRAWIRNISEYPLMELFQRENRTGRWEWQCIPCHHRQQCARFNSTSPLWLRVMRREQVFSLSPFSSLLSFPSPFVSVGSNIRAKEKWLISTAGGYSCQAGDVDGAYVYLCFQYLLGDDG